MAVINNVVVLHHQPLGYDFKKNINESKIINENEKVLNDYYWKSNKAEDEDWTGRALNLTWLINKPDGYLQGRLSDQGDVDCYKFNIMEHRILGYLHDQYDLDIIVTLDHIPEGCDYDLVLYDGDGNQVGIGQDNGSGGKSVTIPNWNLENREYTVKVLAKDGSPVNTEEYYHLSFQTQQAEEDNVLRQEAEEMQKYGGSLRRKLHEGQDATEEIQALQQIRDKYAAYYAQQLNELHNRQAEEYLAEGEVFDESRKEELLSKMAAGEELTEQERGLLNIFASAQEIDSAAASAKLKEDLSEKIFRQMEQAGISPIPSFEVSIGVDGKAQVKGIEDAAVREKVEDILNRFSGELTDTYISINGIMEELSREEQYVLEAAREIEAFLQKATGGNVSLSDITVENFRINGLDKRLDNLLNHPGENQTYFDYASDIFMIKNYERIHGTGLLKGFRARYIVDGKKIRAV